MGYKRPKKKIMATYIIISRVSPESFSNPYEFKKIAETVASKISLECPDVKWKESTIETMEATPWDEFIKLMWPEITRLRGPVHSTL
jgi:hypothetical protein